MQILISDPVEFGRRISDRRLDMGTSRHALADAIKKNYTSLYKYESGESTYIDDETADALCRELKMSKAYLLTGKGKPPETDEGYEPDEFCCIYNEHINCFYKQCSKCGWNPDVAKARIKRRFGK